MPYFPKRHVQWIGLVELVQLVQTESECDVEAARDQIRNALVDGAICPLDWEPAPTLSIFCRVRYEFHVRARGIPIYPPPLSPEVRDYFIDTRRLLHWRDVEIDWRRGLVLDDFALDAYRHMDSSMMAYLGGHNLPPPYSHEWRTLWLDREACERIWPRHHVAPSPAVAAESPSGIRTTAAAEAERACEKWITTLTVRPINKEAAFEAAQNAVGNKLTRRAFERVWAKTAPIAWKGAGRRKR